MSCLGDISYEQFVSHKDAIKDNNYEEEDCSMPLPYITGSGRHTELYVAGKPFRALSGELHNSSASSLDYMEKVVWPALRPLHMNNVIAPVYWECIEPEEGVFDYTLVDGLIAQARREGVTLTLLWFGLWKNSASTYIPQWAKLDRARFVYMTSNGVDEEAIFHKADITLESVSPLCEEAVQADAKAFGNLMRHIREVDPDGETVIAVQVENEIGVLGSSRDYSPMAQVKFDSLIPEEVAKEYGKAGTWSEAFGDDADELFMAYWFAKAINKIASAGAKEHKIIYYVNAWLEQFPDRAGQYPTGGPVFKVRKMWRLMAPVLSFLAPDIYVDHFRDVCDEYASDGNPLFIPETRASKDTVPFLFYAVGKHNALCFAPFGIEDLLQGAAGLGEEELRKLNIDPTAMGGNRIQAGRLLAQAYEMIGNMDGLIREAHREDRIQGFLQYHDKGTVLRFTKYSAKVTYGLGGPFSPPPSPNDPVAGGFIIEIAPNEFYIAGVSCTVTFYSNEKRIVGILLKEEGTFKEGVWQRGRILNGDEMMLNRFGSAPTVQHIKLYEY